MCVCVRARAPNSTMKQNKMVQMLCSNTYEQHAAWACVLSSTSPIKTTKHFQGTNYSVVYLLTPQLLQHISWKILSSCYLAVNMLKWPIKHFCHWTTKLLYNEVLGGPSAGAAEYTDCKFAEVGLDSPKECPGYDTKQSDGSDTVMLKLWSMRGILLLSSLKSLLVPGVVAIDRVLSRGQIEMFDI